MFEAPSCSFEFDIFGEQLLDFATKCLFMLLVRPEAEWASACHLGE